MTLFDQGFAVIENCFSQPACDAIIEQLDAIFGIGTRCLLDYEWCQSLATPLKGRVEKSIPEIASLVAVQCTFFNKSPNSKWFVAYHQDRSIPVLSSVSSEDWPGWSQKEGTTFVHGPDELLSEMIAVRLHLDDSTVNNGPLRVIAGSHSAGTLSPEDAAKLRDSADEHHLIVEKGGLVVMRPLLLHASSKSRTMESRPVLHFLFGPTTLPAGLQWRRTV